LFIHSIHSSNHSNHSFTFSYPGQLTNGTEEAKEETAASPDDDPPLTSIVLSPISTNRIAKTRVLSALIEEEEEEEDNKIDMALSPSIEEKQSEEIKFVFPDRKVINLNYIIFFNIPFHSIAFYSILFHSCTYHSILSFSFTL